MRKTMVRLAAVVTALLAFGITNTEADLIEVDQTIWGMDCAPCAYGMEKGLKNLEGVDTVKVSLNKGNAVIQFTTDNKLALADIRRVVSAGGFTPKETKIKISGTLQRESEELRLHVGDTKYVLRPSEGAKDVWQDLQETAPGTSVTILGDTPADHDDRIFVRKLTQSETPNIPTPTE